GIIGATTLLIREPPLPHKRRDRAILSSDDLDSIKGTGEGSHQGLVRSPRRSGRGPVAEHRGDVLRARTEEVEAKRFAAPNDDSPPPSVDAPRDISEVIAFRVLGDDVCRTPLLAIEP